MANVKTIRLSEIRESECDRVVFAVLTRIYRSTPEADKWVAWETQHVASLATNIGNTHVKSKLLNLDKPEDYVCDVDCENVLVIVEDKEKELENVE